MVGQTTHHLEGGERSTFHARGHLRSKKRKIERAIVDMNGIRSRKYEFKLRGKKRGYGPKGQVTRKMPKTMGQWAERVDRGGEQKNQEIRASTPSGGGDECPREVSARKLSQWEGGKRETRPRNAQ